MDKESPRLQCRSRETHPIPEQRLAGPESSRPWHPPQAQSWEELVSAGELGLILKVLQLEAGSYLASWPLNSTGVSSQTEAADLCGCHSVGACLQ